MKRKNEPVRGFKPAQKVLWTTFVCSMLMFLANAKTDLNRTLAPMDSNLIGVELQTQISGSITDADGVPLPGANIVEKGTSNGVTADFDGNFTIEVANENATLVVSYIGYATKEIALNGQTTIAVSLEESAAGLDEVVLIGYGTQKKSDLTGAVGSVSSEELQERPTSNLTQSLSGKMPGVSVSINSGRPGGKSNIRILRKSCQ